LIRIEICIADKPNRQAESLSWFSNSYIAAYDAITPFSGNSLKPYVNRHARYIRGRG
jgi:hypothetical protein